MTGLEWVTALVRLNGYGEEERRGSGAQALAGVDLLDAADKKIGAYSKGMRQRVKLAQAIVHDAAAADSRRAADRHGSARRAAARSGMIKDWGRAGKSIIVSSHILHEIESMTSNILLINNGRILAEGDVHQIRDLIDDASAHRVHPRRRSARARAAVPGSTTTC